MSTGGTTRGTLFFDRGMSFYSAAKWEFYGYTHSTTIHYILNIVLVICVEQQSDNLLQQALRCFILRRRLSPQKNTSFLAEAKAIDAQWNIPLDPEERLAATLEEAREGEAKNTMKRKKEFRQIHLNQRIAEMPALGSDEYKIRVARNIKRIEQQRIARFEHSFHSF